VVAALGTPSSVPDDAADTESWCDPAMASKYGASSSKRKAVVNAFKKHRG